VKVPFPSDAKQEPEVVLTKESLVVVRSWLQEHRNSIPEEILPFLLAMLDMCEDAQVLLKHNKKLVDLLRQHMGFVPTKERNGKDTPKKKPEEEWTKEEESALHRKMKKAREKWREYKQKRPKKRKKSVGRKNAPNPGPEGDPGEPESPPTATAESVFQLPAAQIATQNEERPVDREKLPTGLGTLVSSWKSRTRYNLSLLLTTINYEVETVQCTETGFSRTATVDDGPARFRITWDGIAQIVLLVVGMCIPLVRLATSLAASVRYFSPSRIYRICLYAAHACFAVYCEMFRQLATCSLFNGDDTNNKVLAMRVDNPALSEEEVRERVKRLTASKEETDPQRIDLLLEAEDLLGTQMPTKDGKGLKQSIFTTVVIGQRPELGPRAAIVFYHSERKSFGDVLGKILALRQEDPKLLNQPIVIQSDLSSSNIPNPLPANLTLVFVGCAAHARRPFWRYRKDADPLVGYHCYTMLLLFDKIFDSDREARATGSDERILQMRQEEQQPLWNEIKHQAEEILANFAPNSDMGKAASYIINHFNKLTRYLSDSRLRPDNNWAERLLRYEKVMLDNSKFRVSKRGRLVYDILRTILATCTTAEVSPFHYLVHVFKNQVDARKNPANYTPYAYATREKTTMPLSNND
jgi:hypothetical protein